MCTLYSAHRYVGLHYFISKGCVFAEFLLLFRIARHLVVWPSADWQHTAVGLPMIHFLYYNIGPCRRHVIKLNEKQQWGFCCYILHRYVARVHFQSNTLPGPYMFLRTSISILLFVNVLFITVSCHHVYMPSIRKYTVSHLNICISHFFCIHHILVVYTNDRCKSLIFICMGIFNRGQYPGHSN